MLAYGKTSSVDDCVFLSVFCVKFYCGVHMNIHLSNTMDPNESVMNKMQHKYWVTKQTVFRKLGRKEDECIVASDSELDAKLELFNSIQKTTGCLLKVISRYQTNLSSKLTITTKPVH